MGGSGRASVAKLATFIAEMELFYIDMWSNYKLDDWKNDIRSLLKKCGIDNTPTVFVLPDFQLNKNIKFLEDVHLLLTTCDIPNLYNKEQMLELVEKMQQVAQQERLMIELTPLNMHSKFLERCKQNLHLVVTLSPVGDSLRNYIRCFPSLLNCCTIDWFTVTFITVWFLVHIFCIIYVLDAWILLITNVHLEIQTCFSSYLQHSEIEVFNLFLYLMDSH